MQVWPAEGFDIVQRVGIQQTQISVSSDFDAPDELLHSHRFRCPVRSQAWTIVKERHTGVAGGMLDDLGDWQHPSSLIQVQKVKLGEGIGPVRDQDAKIVGHA